MKKKLIIFSKRIITKKIKSKEKGKNKLTGSRKEKNQ
jgi:hypothetical protein